MHRLITTLVVLSILAALAGAQCQTLTQVPFWTSNFGLSCPFFGATSDENHFFRVFRASDHGITNPVEVCAVSFPVWFAQSGDGVSGNCVVIRLYRDTVIDQYPGDGSNPAPVGQCGAALPPSLTLIAEDYAYVPDSASGGVFRHEMDCASPLWDPFAPPNELVVEVFFPCPAASGGKVEIGCDFMSTAQSFIQAPTCGFTVPAPAAFVTPVFTEVIIDVHVEVGGSGCIAQSCVGVQMEHPGTNEDLLLVSANRGFLGFGPSSDMSDGHGGETEKTAVSNDIIELRFGSPCGTFDFASYILLATLHDPSGSATNCTPCGPTVASIFTSGKLDIYAQIASPFGPPFLTAVADSGILGPGCLNNRHWFLIDPILNGTGYEWLWQLYVFSGAAQNIGIAASNGHDFGPF